MGKWKAMTPLATALPFISRGVWFALLLLQVVVFTAGMAVWVSGLREPCIESFRACSDLSRLTAPDVTRLQQLGWSLDGYAGYTLISRTLQKLLQVTVGVLIFWRRRRDPMAWVASTMLIIGLESSVADTLATAQPIWLFPTRVMQYIGSVCFCIFFFIFPTGRFVPIWTRWFTLIWAGFFFPVYFLPGSTLDVNQYPLLAGIFALPIFGGFGVAQLYRYRRISSTVERTQTKWVVFATVIGLLALLISLATVLGRPSDTRITPFWALRDFGFNLLFIILPMAVGIAILRYRLWDIDIIVRRTLVYAILTSILAAIYFGGIVLAQQVFRVITGQTSDLAIVISTLLIAALFTPIRRRVQDVIDRRLYRRKYDAEKTLQRFNTTLRDEVNLDELKQALTGVVDDTMQPARIALWLPETKRTNTREIETLSP